LVRSALNFGLEVLCLDTLLGGGLINPIPSRIIVRRIILALRFHRITRDFYILLHRKYAAGAGDIYPSSRRPL